MKPIEISKAKEYISWKELNHREMFRNEELWMVCRKLIIYLMKGHKGSIDNSFNKNTELRKFKGELNEERKKLVDNAYNNLIGHKLIFEKEAWDFQISDKLTYIPDMINDSKKYEGLERKYTKHINRPLNRATVSNWIAIFALLVTIGFSTWSTYQNIRQDAVTVKINDTLKVENIKKLQ